MSEIDFLEALNFFAAVSAEFSVSHGKVGGNAAELLLKEMGCTTMLHSTFSCLEVPSCCRAPCA